MPPLNRYYLREDSHPWEYPAEDSPRSYSTIPHEPTRKVSTRRRKNVRFSDHVSVQPHTQRSEYTCQEKKDSYLSAAEYNETRRDMAHAVFLMRNYPERLDDLEYTSRGLEGRLREVAHRRHGQRVRGWLAVKDAQLDVQMMGSATDGDVLIAKAYIQANGSYLADSLRIAAQDSIDAEKYQQEARPKEEIFSDDWISSVSGHTDSSSVVSPPPYSDLLDVSGFDDSWLHDGFSIPIRV